MSSAVLILTAMNMEEAQRRNSDLTLAFFEEVLVHYDPEVKLRSVQVRAKLLSGTLRFRFVTASTFFLDFQIFVCGIRFLLRALGIGSIRTRRQLHFNGISGEGNRNKKYGTLVEVLRL